MTLWLKILVVGAGGAAGAILRTLVTEFAASRWSHASIGTFICNTLGCFLIGLVGAAIHHQDWGSPEARALVLSGFLGAFTTFSTFEANTFELWRAGHKAWAATYMGGSVVVGLIAFLVAWAAFTRVVT